MEAPPNLPELEDRDTGATFEARSLPRRAQEGDLDIAFRAIAGSSGAGTDLRQRPVRQPCRRGATRQLVDMLAMMVAGASPATTAGPKYAATEEASRG